MEKLIRKSKLRGLLIVCTLTMLLLTACNKSTMTGTKEHVDRDANGAYVETVTVTLGRYAEPAAAAVFPEGQTFEDNAYTRYIEAKLNVDLVDAFEACNDAYTNQMATGIVSGELPDIVSVTGYDITFEEKAGKNEASMIE